MSNAKQIAFSKAYDRCHEQFVRYCSALCFGKMDTEDLVQDVLVSAYKHWEKIEDKQQFLHYLIRAARNRFISNWRKQKRQSDISEIQFARLEAKGVRPDALIDVEYMYAQLNKLPEKQRNALVLFEISGFSMREIAAIQNSTEGAVKTKISRGRAKLKDLMQDEPKGMNLTSYLQTVKSIML